MRYRFLLVGGLALALAGQGCAPAPAVSPQPTPAVPPTTASPTPTPTPTPTPAPKPTTKPAPSGNRIMPRTITIEMKDNVFSPQVTAVNAGDTVIWKNVGKMPHTTTDVSGALLWDSGSLAPGKSYSRKFTAAGTYNYTCSNHKGMNGTVIVGAIQPNQ